MTVVHLATNNTPIKPTGDDLVYSVHINCTGSARSGEDNDRNTCKL